MKNIELVSSKHPAPGLYKYFDNGVYLEKINKQQIQRLDRAIAISS